MEHKATTPQVKTLETTGAGQAVIATLNEVDRERDVTLPNAFGEQFVKLLIAHDTKAVQVGDARLYEHGPHLMADFQIYMDMISGQELYKSLKNDLARHRLQEWSYGYHVLDHSLGQLNGKQVRFLKKIKAVEISPVVYAAGVGTGTLSVKSAPAISAGKRGVRHRMNAKDHLGEAATSIRLSRGQIALVQHWLEQSPRVQESLSEVLRRLEAAEAGHHAVEEALDAEPPVILESPAPPPAEVQTAAPEPPAPPVKESGDEPGEEKAEGIPIREDVQHLKDHLERVTGRLEAIQRLRGTASDRYPQGRPLPQDLLTEVDAFIPRLLRLKGMRQEDEQHHAQQQELQEVSERLKRFGIAV